MRAQSLRRTKTISKKPQSPQQRRNTTVPSLSSRQTPVSPAELPPSMEIQRRIVNRHQLASRTLVINLRRSPIYPFGICSHSQTSGFSSSSDNPHLHKTLLSTTNLISFYSVSLSYFYFFLFHSININSLHFLWGFSYTKLYIQLL